MNSKWLGTIAGLAFGVVLFWQGAGAAFAVLFFTLFGWFTAKVLMGEVDLLGYLQRASQRRQMQSKE